VAKLNVRQGSGQSIGVGRGAGTPGYPVPPEMIPDEEGPEISDKPIDEESIVEDIIAAIVPVGIVKTTDPVDVFDERDALDIVTNAVLDGLVVKEGGGAVGGDRISKENVGPTLQRFEAEILKKIPHKSVKPIGSTGKKSSSGDIDLGLDTDMSLEDITNTIKNLGPEVKLNKGLGEVSVKFPQYSSEGIISGKHVQIDLMVGPEAWTQFQYYGPSEDESKYTGVHVRGIVNAIMSVITGHSVSPSRGIFMKGDQDKKYNQDPEHAVALISKGSSQPWTVQDLKQPFEKIWTKVQASFKPEELQKIKEYYRGFMKSTKREVPKELGEAEEATPKDLPKGIAHLEDMKPEEFMTFLEKYKDLPIKGGLEVSEKVDGSARITFGIENGKIWTQSKNGQKRTDASQYGDKPMFKSLKMAHQALASKEGEIAKAWPQDVAMMVAEVLYTKIPNTIEYGPNVIMIHGVHKSDGGVIPEVEGKKIAEAVTKSAGQKLNDGEEDWKFEYKRIISPEEVFVDVKNEFDSLKQIHDHLKQLAPDKLKASGKAAYKAALDNFKNIQLALKKKFVGQLRKQKSAYGPEGGDVEGIVFRDLESGQLTKLVDKDYFTKLNTFLWQYRKLLDTGVKIGDKWEFGIMQKFRNAISDNVMGSPVAKSTTFVSQLKKFGAELDYPAEANTPDKKADYILSQYIKKNDLMKGDYVSSFKKELETVRKEFDKLQADWDAEKSGEISHDVKDDSGNVIKKVKMDQIIKKRTDEAFAGMKQFLDGVSSSIPKIESMKGELTKKTALLKLMLGQNRFEKITTGEDVNEDSQMTPSRQLKSANNADVALFYKDKLAKRGIEIKGMPLHLGTGTKGSAFDIGDGKVLKITADFTEAQASLKLKGVKSDHIAHIYDVFAFPKSKMGERFGIVLEKLTGIPGAKTPAYNSTGEGGMLNQAFTDSLFWQAKSKTDGGDWNTTFGLMKSMLSRDIKNVGSEASAKMQKRFYDSIETLKKYDVPQMVDEVAKNGISYEDYHAANIMKRQNGKYVIMDLGYSSTDGGQEPEVLEATNEPWSQSLIAKPDEVLNVYSDKLLKRGVNVSKAKELGSGYNGVAYDVGGKVLKITEDETEALASNHIKGKKFKHIVHINDVFAMPTKDAKWYGIVQEKLSPITNTEEVDFSRAVKFIMSNVNNIGDPSRHSLNPWTLPWEEIKSRVTHAADVNEAEEIFSILEKMNFPEMLEELNKNKIEFSDVHAGNIMKRGSDYVLIDLGGSSKSPGTTPKQLEQKIVESILEVLGEAKADKVGVTIGRYQPFHKGHAEVIRDLAHKFNKVIVIVAGNTKDKKNPFSFDLRLEMMKKSLPDVFSKLEVHKAEFDGKNSGFIPGVLSDIVKNKRSTLEADVAATILVGQDRAEEMKKQLQSALKYKEAGNDLFFDPGLAVVQALPDVKNDDEADRVSATRVREAIATDKEDVVKSLVDPHLVSNEDDFQKIYAALKKEMGTGSEKKQVKEALGVGADIPDIEETLDNNAASLLSLRPYSIDINKRKQLGKGKDGIAYDVGNNVVLKVTTDNPEAISSFALKGKSNKHVVRIHDVFKFREETSPARLALFGIVTEKLTPLSGGEKNELDDVLGWAMDPELKDSVRPFLAKGDYPGMMNAIQKEMTKMYASGRMKEEGVFDSSGSSTAASPLRAKTTAAKQTSTSNTAGKKPEGNKNPAELAKTEYKHVEDIFKKFQIPEMMKELQSSGISFSDYHSENIMKRGSDYVINDLGRSAANSAAQPRKLESVVNDIVENIIREIGAMDGLGSSATGKIGKSAWSSSMNQVDTDSEEQWQNQLNRIQNKGFGKPEEVTNESLEEDEQQSFGFDNKDEKSQFAPLTDGVWIPWSEFNTTPFEKGADKSGEGRGERKVAMELRLRKEHATLAPDGKSYDLVVNGKNYEVKENTSIRIEKTGQKALRETMKFFSDFVDALEESLTEITAAKSPTGDPLGGKEMSINQLLEFTTTAKESISNGAIPLGLIGLTVDEKSPKFPYNFKQVTKFLNDIVKKSDDKKQKIKLTVGDGGESIDVFDQDIDAVDARAIFKLLKKISGIDHQSVMTNVVAHIIDSNFRLRNINLKQVDDKYVENVFFSAYDPTKILSDIDKIVVVDEEKGFFMFDPNKLLIYFKPGGISKSTQGLHPVSPLGGKSKKSSAKTTSTDKSPAQKKKEPKQTDLIKNVGGKEKPGPVFKK